MHKMSKRRWTTVACLGMAAATFAASSPSVSIRAVAEGHNLDWGQLHETVVPLNWAWPAGATRAELKIVANGKAVALRQTFEDPAVSSFSWNMGVPSADTVYDVSLTFDSGEIQTAQLYANPGSFGGVPLKGWNADGRAALLGGGAIPYRAAWDVGLAGAATFGLDGEQAALPYADGYLCVPRKRGMHTATLDFAVEPRSPAFSVALAVAGPGLVLMIQ